MRERASTHAMAAVVAIYGIPTVLFAEHYPANQGLGDDGVTYAAMVKHFSLLVQNQGFESYRLWRAGPCGVLWAVFKGLGIDPSAHNIMMGFRWLNLAALLGVVYFLGGIARKLELDERATWFAFIGLFASFFALKWVFYDPVLVDCSGFLVACAVLWAFLTRRIWLLAAFTLVAGFTWQLVFFTGVALLVFPRVVEWRPVTPAITRRATAVAAVVFVVALAFLLWLPDAHEEAWDYLAPFWGGVHPLSSALAAGWIALGIFPIAKAALSSRRVRLERTPMLLGAGVAVFVFAAREVLSAHTDHIFSALSNLTPWLVLKTGLFTGINKPAAWLVAHVVFWGPIVLVVVLMWGRAVRIAQRWGLGVLGIMAVAAGYSIDSESRQLLSFVPLVVVLTAAAVAPYLRTWHVVAFGALSVVASKAWLTINHGATSEGGFPFTGAAFEYPYQYFFRNIGPFMSGENYSWQGAVILVGTVAVVAVLAATRSFHRGSGARPPVDLSPPTRHMEAAR